MRRQGGFTLLEILIALLVLGLLMVGLVQGVRTGIAMWAAQRHRVADTADLDAAARLLRRLLTGIPQSSANGFTSAGPSRTGEIGDRRHFSFVADLPTGLGTTRRDDVTLELDDRRIVLRWLPHRDPAAQAIAATPMKAELVRGVERLELAYWGSPSPGQPDRWLSQWSSAANPVLIRIRLIFPKGDRRRWPDLIIACRL
jgi:general secretion pathway protein J